MYIWGATYVKVGNFNFIFIHYHSNVILLVKKLYKNYIWGAIYVKVSNFNFFYSFIITLSTVILSDVILLVRKVCF